MGIHADAGPAVAHGHDEVGRLPPDAVEREQIVDRVRHAPGEPPEQVAADPPDDTRLRAIEADGIDEALDAMGGELQHALRGGGLGEEAVGRRARRRVLGAKRQDAGDQDTKRVAISLGHDRERGRIPAWRASPQLADHGTDRNAFFLSVWRSPPARQTSFMALSAWFR